MRQNLKVYVASIWFLRQSSFLYPQLTSLLFLLHVNDNIICIIPLEKGLTKFSTGDIIKLTKKSSMRLLSFSH